MAPHHACTRDLRRWPSPCSDARQSNRVRLRDSVVRSARMAKTIQIQQTGGPEQMKLVDVPVGEPGPGEIRIRHHACGLNFIDVYHRTGLYPLPLPSGLGSEAAGVVE